MKNLIEESKAYNALSSQAKSIINKRRSRLQIEDAIIQAKTMGLEAWKAISPIPDNWKKIVEEIA